MVLLDVTLGMEGVAAEIVEVEVLDMMGVRVAGRVDAITEVNTAAEDTTRGANTVPLGVV